MAPPRKISLLCAIDFLFRPYLPAGRLCFVRCGFEVIHRHPPPVTTRCSVMRPGPLIQDQEGGMELLSAFGAGRDQLFLDSECEPFPDSPPWAV